MPLRVVDYPLFRMSGELVTPTGASILKALCVGFGSVPGNFHIEQIGIGAGDKEFEHPNICRALIGELEESPHHLLEEKVTLLEANIDDMNPQILGYVMERLIELGALDVWSTPIQVYVFPRGDFYRPR